MTTAIYNIGPAYLGWFEEIEGELTKVIEDFERAVNIESLHRTDESGKWLFPRYFMLSGIV